MLRVLCFALIGLALATAYHPTCRTRCKLACPYHTSNKTVSTTSCKAGCDIPADSLARSASRILPGAGQGGGSVYIRAYG